MALSELTPAVSALALAVLSVSMIEWVRPDSQQRKNVECICYGQISPGPRTGGQRDGPFLSPK